MSVTVVGIDPGLDGGLTAITHTEGEFQSLPISIPMPTLGGGKGKRKLDLAGIKNFLLETKPDLVVMELVGARPGQGVTSMFNFGYTSGQLEALVFSLGISYSLISPQTWQKKCFEGIPRNVSKPSTIFCARMFPSFDWRGTERSRTPHDGKTDSCCLAYYAIITKLVWHQKKP